MADRSLPLIIGHRGASWGAPENTLAAFRLAWEEGADGIEADFRLTRDGQVVCIHDPGTGRTAPAGLKVADATLEELRRLEFGGWKGDAWRGEEIPTLEDVIASLPTDKLLFIELKCGAEVLPHLERMLPILPCGRLRILSFDAGLLALAAKRLPGIRSCLNMDLSRLKRSMGRQPLQASVMEILLECGAAGLSAGESPLLDRCLAERLGAAGMELHVWTVDSPAAAARYAAMGACSIMTNRPGWLRSMLAPEPRGEGWAQ